MSIAILLTLSALTGVFMLIERRGWPVTLELRFKGDLKRESRWFAQYGQAGCTIVVACLIGCMERRHKDVVAHIAALLLAGFSASLLCMALKRLLGRVRPGRENAGRFLGTTWRHASHRESFPSSHSAAAFATSVVLARLYPPAAPVFYTLAVICALIRYLMDAHWPSDVLAGIAVGYGMGLVFSGVGG
jgi:membrane-associated phospholipid phosphatase